MVVFALTEHMPREQEDLYPEEVGFLRKADFSNEIDEALQIDADITPAILEKLFDDYYHQAIQLQKAYASQIKIIVGVEVDWIRASSEQFITNLLAKYPFEIFIGSVHHVHTRPIDYDHQMYAQALELAGGTEERLFEDYFDAQYRMLMALKPPIVGHFDVIRLKSKDPEGALSRGEGVWHRVLRNLDFIAGYGGVLELNSAALRKGMSEPYPKAEEFLAKGGRFTLSDDSHGVDQVGSFYDRLLRFVKDTGIRDVVVFQQGSTTRDSRFRNIDIATVTAAYLTDIWQTP
ncbi:histidinol-phosphatase [Physcia stellaris]|nr:histidinol-phosphatase [Physcia stellaris]